MKDIGKLVATFIALMVFLAACNGSSQTAEPAETETPTSAEESPAPTATATATPDAEAPEVTDQDLIDAALAAQEASPAPEGTIAWDVLETDVTEDGTIRFKLCTWDGLTAFDEVRDVRYRTTVDDDGTITATNFQDSVAAGECLNTHLIETAVELIHEYDQFWAEVTDTPELFATDPRRIELLTEAGLSDHQTLTGQWVSDDTQLRGTQTGRLPDALEAPLAARSFTSDGQSFFEITICREMDEKHGLYRDEVLLDNFKEGSGDGPHDIAFYALVPDITSEQGWRVDLTDGLIWGDCYTTGDWIGAVNIWKPDPAEWAPLGPPYAP